MNTTSKSPKKVAQAALQVAFRALPRYTPLQSKKHTQPQLFACLFPKMVQQAIYEYETTGRDEQGRSTIR
jgi:hypothetical protein